MFCSFSLLEEGLSGYFDDISEGNVSVQEGSMILFEWFKGLGLRKPTIESYNYHFIRMGDCNKVKYIKDIDSACLIN